ncbi:MAG: histone H1 [Planctomycetes bacterium]|nr:histone H1 [Planctomycetota bacterium]
MQEYEDLKTMVAEIEDDLNKAEGGNKAAGTRVRKQMQQIKKVANAIRSKILELRSSVIATTSSE